MSQINPGDILSSDFDDVDIWDESLENNVSQVHAGELLLVLGPAVASSMKPDSQTQIEFNVKHYSKVVTPAGVVGFVYHGNCSRRYHQ